LIEQRFLNSKSMTKRDKDATTPEDLFNFDTSPSLNATLTQAQPPVDDCTPPGGGGAFGQTLRQAYAQRKSN
jgi:hypothetical protein